MASHYDFALFLYYTDKGTILLLLYVDDMIITGDDFSGIQELKVFLSRQFEMKDLGHLSYFLGLEITHSTDGLYITQAKYASELLSRAGLTDSKTVDTPVELNAHLTPTGGKPLSNPSLYRRLVSSLVYLIKILARITKVPIKILARITKVASPLLAESEALLWAVQLAIREGWNHGIFEGDAKSCFNAVNSPDLPSPWIIRTSTENILALHFSFLFCSFVCLRRACNSAAHNIVKFA